MYNVEKQKDNMHNYEVQHSKSTKQNNLHDRAK